MASSSVGVRAFLRRAADAVGERLLHAIASIVRALPARWIPSLGDHLGRLVFLLDRRGRRVGRANLRAVFGDGMGARRRRAVLLASYRNSLRSVVLLLHVAPMTPARMRRWVDVSPETARRARALACPQGGVAVSGHLGNWELLLGLPALIDGVPDLAFLAEGFHWDPLDRFLADLRGTGGGVTILRHGGARGLNRHVRGGGIAALLADRNLRRQEGGIWAPFLGLEARTTPLPAWLAVRADVPIAPVFCLPRGDGRYRFWVGPDLAAGVDRSDPEAAVREVTRRVNHVLESTIRAEPEIWNWTLKRFKSRPDRELGPYPAYSLWDA